LTITTVSTQHIHSPEHSSGNAGWPWIVVAVGYFLPGVIGVCVRQYLVSIGKPVMPWSWVAQELPVLAIFSMIWVVPFVMVALLNGRLKSRGMQFQGLIYGAFLGTAVSEIIVFIEAWWNVEAVVLGFLVIPFLVFGGTLLGSALGFCAGWVIVRLRH
jgi:hypothetical protein